MEVEIAKNIEENKRKEFDEKINLLIGNPKPLIDKIKVLISILMTILEKNIQSNSVITNRTGASHFVRYNWGSL